MQHLVASVRREPAGAVLDLRGEINGFGQETLNTAYAETEKGDLEVIIKGLTFPQARVP